MLTNIFQMGWNHKPELDACVFLLACFQINYTMFFLWFGFLWEGLLFRGIPRIPNHQSSICWSTILMHHKKLANQDSSIYHKYVQRKHVHSPQTMPPLLVDTQPTTTNNNNQQQQPTTNNQQPTTATSTTTTSTHHSPLCFFALLGPPPYLDFFRCFGHQDGSCLFGSRSLQEIFLIKKDFKRYMGVSENGGTPKWMVSSGKPY